MTPTPDYTEMSTEQELWRLNLVRLWEGRKDTSLSQQSAAEAGGFDSQATVSRYLSGAFTLNDGAILKFARVLGVEPAQINPRMLDVTLLHADPVARLTEIIRQALNDDGPELVFQRFEQLLAERNLNKADIARHFDIKPPSIHKWFSERRIPTERLFALPTFFNCSLLDILAPAISHTPIVSTPEDGTPSSASIRVQYTRKQLTDAVDSLISRPLRLKLGLMRGVEEAALQSFMASEPVNPNVQRVREALIDVREHGEFMFMRTNEEDS